MTEYLLSVQEWNTFYQDTIEAFFLESKGLLEGGVIIPQCIQVCSKQSQQVQGSAALEPVRRNCGKRPCRTTANDTLVQPLPKRCRSKC